MIHTAKYHRLLTQDDMSYISTAFNQSSINVAIASVDNNFKGITTFLCRFYNKQHLIVSVNFIELLAKTDIKDSDIYEINGKIAEYTKMLLGSNNDTLLTLTRLDYRMDFHISRPDREILFKLHSKTLKRKGHYIKTTPYKTTTYIQSKSLKCTIYDKEIERRDKGIAPHAYEIGIMRYEVALLNTHLSYNLKTHGISKNLQNYLTDSLAKNYFTKYYKPFLTNDDYYSYHKAIDIVRFSNISDKYKKICVDCLDITSRYGLSSLKHKYSPYMYKKIIAIFEDLKISPITIPVAYSKSKDMIENPLKDIFE